MAMMCLHLHTEDSRKAVARDFTECMTSVELELWKAGDFTEDAIFKEYRAETIRRLKAQWKEDGKKGPDVYNLGTGDLPGEMLDAILECARYYSDLAFKSQELSGQIGPQTRAGQPQNMVERNIEFGLPPNRPTLEKRMDEAVGMADIYRLRMIVKAAK